MPTLQQSAQIAELSVFVYDKVAFTLPDGVDGSAPEGWTRIAKTPEEGSFAAAAYKNNTTGEIVIAYRGSDDKGDWLGANLGLATGTWDPQFSEAIDFAYQIKYNPLYEGATILTTGDSLGGALAQIAAQAHAEGRC